MDQNADRKSSRIATLALLALGVLVGGTEFIAHAAPKTVTTPKAVFKRGSFPKCFGYQGDRAACVAELNQIIDAGDFKEADLQALEFALHPGEVSEKILMAAMAVKALDVTRKNESVGDLILVSDFNTFSKSSLDKVTDYLLEESCSDRAKNFGFHLYYVSAAAPLSNESLIKLAASLNESCELSKKRLRRFEPVSGFLFESELSLREPMRSQIIRYYSKNRSIGGIPGESIDGRATIIEHDYHRRKYVHSDRPVSVAAVTRLHQMGLSLNDQEFSDLISIESDYSLSNAIEDRSIHSEILKGALNSYDRAQMARQVMGRQMDANIRYTPGGGLVAGTGLTGASTLTRSGTFLADIFTIAARRAKLFRVHQLPPGDAKRFAEFLKAEITRRAQALADQIKSNQIAESPDSELSRLLVDMRILRNVAPKAQDIRTFANLLAQAKQTPFRGSDIGLVVALVGLYDSPMSLAQKLRVVRYIDGWKLGHKIDTYIYSLFLLNDGDPFSPDFQTLFNTVNPVDQFAKYQLNDALKVFFGTMGITDKVWSSHHIRAKQTEWYRAKTATLNTKGYVVPDIEMIP